MVKLDAIFACAFVMHVHSTSAFTTREYPSIVNNFGGSARQHLFAIEATPQPDGYSDAFTAYMTKSHEEKLKAVMAAEVKKNVEIRALKTKLKEMKTGIVSDDLSMEEISTKLDAYQKFMSQYIVKAQEEKAKAVKSAQEAISKKYEDKLNAFMLNPVDASSITTTDKANPVSNGTYDERSATVAAAGAAGKSRWGAAEVDRVTSPEK